ncbi:hypothetical protein AVEN_82513-1 [Araneus ventricosus]|uniref:Uncharacterized protein n=1 Tax=Araneus ventricosus TaxID=182803 RepID=A0A4Y2RYA4_ARAVE|nr:hypothetical protein AVEN_82513-1 [Araneus ventricosus]
MPRKRTLEGVNERLLSEAGHSRALHSTQMAWWLSTPFHFSAHPFRSFTALRANLKPIRYRSLRSPTTPTSPPSFKTRTPSCSDFRLSERASTPRVSTLVAFQHL